MFPTEKDRRARALALINKRYDMHGLAGLKRLAKRLGAKWQTVYAWKRRQAVPWMQLENFDRIGWR